MTPRAAGAPAWLDARVVGLLVGLCIGSLVGLPAIATAQPEAPGEAQPEARGEARGGAPGVPDVPPGEATLRGRVVHADSGAPIAEAEVVLYVLPAGAPPGLRRIPAAPDGSFAFVGIDGDPGTTYLVGARYRGVSYPGARVTFATGEREREVEVPVSEVSSDVASATLHELTVRIDWLGQRLQVSEALRIENTGASTILTPEGGAQPIVELEIPEAAGPLTGTLGVVPPGLVRDGATLRWYGPLFPGSHEVDYGYALALGTDREEVLRLDRSLPGPIRLTVLAPVGGATLEAPGLTAGEPVPLLGRSYQSFSGEVSAGPFTLALRLPEARRDPAAVSLVELRWIGDLDDAALTVREEHTLHVEGDLPVVAGDTPLLRIPLPEGASDFRFAARDSASGLAPLGDALGVLGPLSPGETVIDLSYRLAASDPLKLERRLGTALPLASFYVTDDGNLELRSRRMHKRRPIRSQDRTYLHLEAFELGADETLDVEIASLPPRLALPPGAGVLVMGVAAALAIAALVAPLRGAAEPRDETASESAGQREREALYAALRDLEHDHETGKISAADHDRMRTDLRTRALTLLGEERTRSEAPPATLASKPPAECGSCGHPAGSDDRFCAQCGASLAGEPA